MDRPNTRLWRDDPRPLASSPLIVDAQLSPNLVVPRLRPSPMTARAQQRGCLVGVTEPTGRPCRQHSLRYSQGWTQKLVRQVRNKGRGQVENHLGRNRLTSDAPYKACFSAWARSFAEVFHREVVAIDGKTLRRSFDRGRAQGPLHLVSAWASEQGLVLGQREVDGKSNEITAIPALLETLSLKNCIVTLDAMGCQKTIAGQILDRGVDYLLGLKANHGKAFLAVKECCERHCFARGATATPVFDAFDDSHGRLVRRRVFVCQPGSAARLARVAHRAGGGNHPRCQRLRQGRSGDPLFPVKLRR